MQAQYGSRGQAYATSAVHAAGPDLQRARELAAELARQAGAARRVLDAGCGAGHLSFALAAPEGGGAEVTALDPTSDMLAAVQRVAAERGLTERIDTALGSVQDLPFADAHFDLVASRYSAHHWAQLPQGLSELVRVLRPGGHLLMIDTLGHPDPLCDVPLQAIELLRDASHVRNRSVPEWRALLADAGVVTEQEQQWPLRLEFAPWIARMRTPPERVTAIHSLVAHMAAEARQALRIEADGSFTLQTGLWLACKPA